MMRLFRKKWIAVVGATVIGLSAPIVHKSLPIMLERESHRAFFPKESFQERLKRDPLPWMVAQLKEDFAPFEERKITSEMVEKTYDQILNSIGFVPKIYHFRILNNQLYKFVPDGAPFSDTDSLTEKALKTLLWAAQVPNCDFVFCAVDGVPERHVPSDYYLVEDPNDQAPVLAQAKRETLAPRYVVLVPDQLSLSDQWYRASQEVLEASRNTSWDKKKPIAVWRGGLSDTGEPTDGRFSKNYATTPRFKLCEMGKEMPDLIDAGFFNLDCKEMEDVATRLGFCKGSRSKNEHIAAKYLPVLDGQMCTYPGYQWRLLSNSVCLKQESDQVQWFYKALQPYVHYIPIKNDLSDLVEKINWAKEHDAEAAAIGERARTFALEGLLYEDTYYYLHLALAEYAKHQTIDFQKIKRETEKDPNWKCIQYRKRLGLKKSAQRLKAKLTFLPLFGSGH